MGKLTTFLSRVSKMIKHRKLSWGYMEKSTKLELIKQSLAMHIESRRSLLNISVAAIGLNVAMLTLPNGYHSKLIHMTSGAAVIAFFVAAVSIANSLLHYGAFISTMMDEEVINKIKDSPSAAPFAKAAKAAQICFNTGTGATFLSVLQLFLATMPRNWH